MKKIILILIIVFLVLSNESLRQKFLPFINDYLKSINEKIDKMIPEELKK